MCQGSRASPRVGLLKLHFRPPNKKHFLLDFMNKNIYRLKRPHILKFTLGLVSPTNKIYWAGLQGRLTNNVFNLIL